MSDIEREAFEEAAQENWPCYSLLTDSTGSYSEVFLQGAWEGWQDRAKSDGGAMPEVMSLGKASRQGVSFIERETYCRGWNNCRNAMLTAATQQPAQGTECSERLPVEADASKTGMVRWLRSGVWSNGRWDDVPIDATCWMPTGLKRPTPPSGGE